MKFDNRLIESIDFAVRNLGITLTVHGAHTGFDKYPRSSIERYHMSVCLLMGNAIPNIGTMISDAKEAMQYMLLHIQHFNEKISQTKTMTKMFSGIKFGEEEDLEKPSKTSLNALKWYLKFQNDLNVKKCVETGMELFFHVSRERQVAEADPNAPKTMSIIEPGDKLSLTFQKLISIKGIELPVLTEDQLEKIKIEGL